MKQIPTKFLALWLGSALVLTGCVTSVDKEVELSPTASEDGKYRKALQRATRDAQVIKDFEMRYEIKTTYLSPDFRNAFSERMEEVFLMSNLGLEETRAKAGFFVSIFSPKDEVMELDNPDYWTILLGGKGGAKPVLIKKLHDKPKWRPYFDFVNDWSKEYLVLFDAPSVSPQSPALVEKTAIQVTFANADGKVKLSW